MSMKKLNGKIIEQKHREYKTNCQALLASDQTSRIHGTNGWLWMTIN
jgi:hypothetical protein